MQPQVVFTGVHIGVMYNTYYGFKRNIYFNNDVYYYKICNMSKHG